MRKGLLGGGGEGGEGGFLMWNRVNSTLRSPKVTCVVSHSCKVHVFSYKRFLARTISSTSLKD